MGVYFNNPINSLYSAAPVIRCQISKENSFSIPRKLFFKIVDKHLNEVGDEYGFNEIGFKSIFLSGRIPRNKRKDYKKEIEIEKKVLKDLLAEIKKNETKFFATYYPKDFNKDSYSFHQFIVDLMYPFEEASKKIDCIVWEGPSKQLNLVINKLNPLYKRLTNKDIKPYETIIVTAVKYIIKIESQLSKVILHFKEGQIVIENNGNYEFLNWK